MVSLVLHAGLRRLVLFGLAVLCGRQVLDVWGNADVVIRRGPTVDETGQAVFGAVEGSNGVGVRGVLLVFLRRTVTNLGADTHVVVWCRLTVDESFDAGSSGVSIVSNGGLR